VAPPAGGLAFAVPSLPVTPTELGALVRSIAAGLGDGVPTAIEQSEGTRADAVLVSSGEVVSGSDASYLVVAQGDFVDTAAHRPPGAPAPSGSVLTLVVDASTGQVTDLGIQDDVPDLATLGKVTTDS
jgi:hypothetical protein